MTFLFSTKIIAQITTCPSRKQKHKVSVDIISTKRWLLHAMHFYSEVHNMIQSITYLSTPVSVKVKQDRIFIYDQEYYAYAENVIIIG